jgi:hypothetical protein
MLTSLQYKCVNKHAESESEGFSKSEIFGLGLGCPKSSGFESFESFKCFDCFDLQKSYESYIFSFMSMRQID